MKNVNNNSDFVKSNYTENIISLHKDSVEFNYIVDNTFGEWLRKLRKAQDLSQEDLASRSRVTKSYISKLEKNQITQPRLHQIEKICKVLGASFEEGKKLLFLPKGDSSLPEGLQMSDFEGFDQDDIAEIKKHLEFLKFRKSQPAKPEENLLSNANIIESRQSEKESDRLLKNANIVKKSEKKAS